MRLCTPLALLISLAACGGDAPSGGTPDAKPMGDAAVASVVAVTCPASAPTVTTTSNTDTAVYMPMSTTVSVGGIVKFVMPSMHNVAPNPIKPTDDGLKVDFGATKCLQFNKAGTFNFFCSNHSFAGSITVQ